LPDTTTANLGLTKPAALSAGWAAKVNTNFDLIDASAGSPVFNVKSYGAIGDGSTDDTAALQATADATTIASGTMYFPKGRYRITSNLRLADPPVGSDHSNFNVIGDGPVQSVILCDIASSSSVGVTFWTNKYMLVRGIGVANAQAKGTRTGVMFAGYGSGTQTGQAIFELFSVGDFDTGIVTSDGVNATSSEISFDTLTVSGCNVGFLNNSFNGLNFNIKNLIMSGNAIGLYAFTAGVYVYGGSASDNAIDFQFANGGTNAVHNFRSEVITDKFIVQLGNTNQLVVTGCLAIASASPNTRTLVTLANSGVTMIGNQIGGQISLGNSLGPNYCLTLLNNDIIDPDNDCIEPNTGTASQSMGPGFRFDGEQNGRQFLSIGNRRCSTDFSTVTGTFKQGWGNLVYPSAWFPVLNKLPIVATANLPAASTAMNGAAIIEDAGTGDRNLILYAGGQRFRIDGGANF